MPILMFQKFSLAVSLFSIVSFTPVFAATNAVKDFKTSTDTIHTLVPEGWDAFQNYLQIPVAMVSKKGLQDQRAVIQITPVGIKDDKGEFAKIQKDPEQYYAQKEEMLDNSQGESIAYVPFQETKKDGATIYSIGVKYKNPMGEFLDKTYYISTRSKQIYFVKSLVPLDMQNESNAAVEDVVNSISAKN
jgi:hypothetical protein